jgi:hypothetical protein
MALRQFGRMVNAHLSRAVPPSPYAHRLAAVLHNEPMLFPVEVQTAEVLALHDKLAQDGSIAQFIKPATPQGTGFGRRCFGFVFTRFERLARDSSSSFRYTYLDEYHKAFTSGATTPLEVGLERWCLSC